MSYDAVIVGAGITGLSIGFRAAQMGLEVLVLERDDPADGASAVAAGMLAPVTEATFGEEKLLGLNLAGAARWPSFAQELGAAANQPIDLLTSGTLHLATNRDQAAELERLYGYQKSLDLQVERLTAGACRELEPALHPSIRAGILAREDRAVEPRRVIRALEKSLHAAGGTLRTGSSVRSIRTGDHPAVTLEDGAVLAAGTVVLAAGCWSGLIDGVPKPVAAALRPVKGQILRLRHRPDHPVLLTHVLRTEEVYLVPRADGEVVVGASVEEKGFDTTATAGGVFELLRSAGEVIPGVRELQLAEVNVGLRPGSPDNAPLLGTAAPGLVVAAGHFRNGILLAPITGDGIAQLLATGEPPPELLPFGPWRFDR